MIIKEKLYDFFVRKNGRVRYEYERYVREHLEEHRTKPAKHAWLLIKLNWFYRVKKGNTPYLYWDEPLNEVTIKMDEKKNNHKFFPESKVFCREETDSLIKKFMAYDVICFDVFDTLIFRCVDEPQSVFELMGRIYGLPEFKKKRMEALKKARINQAKQDVTLEEIYIELKRIYGSMVSAENEIQTEMLVIYANPYFQEIVDKLHQMGKRVIAVSDMYLESKDIKKMLMSVGYPEMEVFSSSSYGVNKKNGELQHTVINTYGNEFSYIFIGDNYESDYLASIEAGMDAYWYKACGILGKDYRSKADTSLEGRLYNGIVNNYVHNGLFRGNEYYEHGFIYGGYITFSFCKWIEKRAVKDGVDKLLFLSRDMDIFYKVYNKFFNNISSEYVIFSRFASQQLIACLMPGEYLEFTIKTRINKCSIKEALDIYDLPDFSEALIKNNLYGEEKLTDSNYSILADIIIDNLDLIKKKFETTFIAAKNYFKKIIGNAKNIYILDLGWKGTATLYLKKLFEEWGFDVRVRGALLSVSGNMYAEDIIASGLVDVFMERNALNFTVGVPKGANFEAFRGHMFEATFSSEKSSLLEYQENENFVFSRENPNIDIIREIQRGILDFCMEYECRTRGIQPYIHENGFNANTPINKALKDKSYIIPIWGEVLDEASSESGFVKEAKTKTFFQYMKSCKLVNESDYLEYYGYKIESKNVFICSTYSQVFVTLIKIFSEKIVDVDLILYDDIPNCVKLRNRLRKTDLFNNIVIFSKEGLPRRFYRDVHDIEQLLEIHKKHMLMVERRLQVKLEKYKNIYLYYDGHHLGLYIQEKHLKYNLLEDGMNHFQHIYATPSCQEIPIVNDDTLKAYNQGWGYLCCGQNPDCISIEVNENKDLAIGHTNIIEKPRKTMIEKLDFKQKRMIYNVFLEEEQLIGHIKNNLAIVFTSVLANDGWVDSERTQIRIYRDIVDELKREGCIVVVKPHPRDKIIYSKEFQDCIMIDRMFPSEVLDFNCNLRFKIGVTIASSAMELLNCIEEKRKLGFRFLEKYKENVAPWVLESLQHPEKYNW